MRDYKNILCEFALYSTGGAPYRKHLFKGVDFVVESYKTETGEFSSVILEKDPYYEDGFREELSEVVGKSISGFLKKHKIKKQGLVLAVGVGNEGMTADVLGSKTLDFLHVNEHLHRDGETRAWEGRLAAICGGVSGVTGLPSFDVVKGVVDRVKPSAVIVIDTLSCKRVARLQRVIQITDIGIVPGSGVGSGKTALSEETLGVPVVGIGVPLVIYAKNILADYLGDGVCRGSSEGIKRMSSELKDLLVTVKEIDIAADCFAKIIAGGINAAVL